MKEKIYKILAFILLAAAAGCEYDYNPKDSDIQGLDSPLLTIEGDILVGDVTTVKLGLTQSLNGIQKDIPMGANVWVESESGEIVNGTLVDDQLNKFEIDTRNLSLDGRYRLAVSVPGRGEYLSAFKGVLVPPQIDSITWRITEDRKNAIIEVTTHDENSPIENKNGEYLYCKWSYMENWESNAIFPTELEYSLPNDRMRSLSAEEIAERQYCFSEAESVGPFIANTEKLSRNVIYKYKLKEISYKDNRLSKLYAMSLKQTALDKEAYTFWENIKNNTSATGGLFSPEPSEVRGNIECISNPGEVVIGYINVSTVVAQRLFVNWGLVGIYSSSCSMSDPLPQYTQEDDMMIMVWHDQYQMGNRPVKYVDETQKEVYWSAAVCTDCRIISNSTRPDFWPDDK